MDKNINFWRIKKWLSCHEVTCLIVDESPEHIAAYGLGDSPVGYTPVYEQLHSEIVQYCQIRDNNKEVNEVEKYSGIFSPSNISEPIHKEHISEYRIRQKVIKNWLEDNEISSEYFEVFLENNSSSKIDKLDRRRENSYLVVIASLCKQLNLDWQDRGVSTNITYAVEELGCRISSETARDILESIPDALEVRRT